MTTALTATAPLDCLIVGAGFGGLGTALALAEGGARVAVCERVGYVGGCAGTFERRGIRYEAGATLSSGFGPGQLFAGWHARHQLDLTWQWLDPVVEIRTPTLHLDIPRDKALFVDRLCALPDAPQAQLRAFFQYQGEIADLLWPLLEDPALLPPLTPRALLVHATHAHRYARLLPLLGRPLGEVLARFGLLTFHPVRHVLDALCQITVQCPAAEAEAPFALATLEYPFRGAAHVTGGIGALADGLATAIRQLGGEVHLNRPIKQLRQEGGLWVAETKQGPLRARTIVANVLPQGLRPLWVDAPELAAWSAEVAQGWGAAMLHGLIQPPAGTTTDGMHLDLTLDPHAPLDSGNHVFVSVAPADGRDHAPPGWRTLTASTHVRPDLLHGHDPEAQARALADIHDRMRQTLATRLPGWQPHQLETASPRTFQRFTSRPTGLVGGIPRRAGLHHYRRLGPQEVGPNLWLVGDSGFPGQSTLATATGGVCTARAVLRRLR